ncbi:MAG: FAD synthetase family protein [Spirochaetaceae bacterium]|jgi:riboflavin kinase/FMN adenylyltransferase|nr:FAD synthetase family protein [Spirochaetaceae bacterium]
MRLVSWEDFEAGGIFDGVCGAVTAGVFDGVHKGHRKLIERVVKKAAKLGLSPAIFTFKENPRNVLNGFKGAEHHPRASIIPLEERLGVFSSMGIETCVLIEFSSGFSAMTGADFLKTVLRNANVRFMAVGEDFRCGRNAEFSSERVKEFVENFHPVGPEKVLCEIVRPLLDGGRPVSSSRIREAVHKGDFALASRLLGRRLPPDEKARL